MIAAILYFNCTKDIIVVLLLVVATSVRFSIGCSYLSSKYALIQYVTVRFGTLRYRVHRRLIWRGILARESKDSCSMIIEAEQIRDGSC